MQMTRRRKLSSRSTADTVRTPEKISRICEMGFTPSTSARALRENNGDVAQTVNWLVTNKIADDELISHASELSKSENERFVCDSIDKSKHRNDSSANNVDATSDVTTSGTTSTTSGACVRNIDSRSPSKVQVVIPTKLPQFVVKASQTKAIRRKTKLDPASIEEMQEATKVEKKRGRGRPKKAANASHSDGVVQKDNLQRPEKQGQAEGSPNPPMNDAAHSTPVQLQMDKEVTTAVAKRDRNLKSPELQVTTSTTSIQNTQEPVVLPDRPEVEPITPERVKKPTLNEQLSSNRAKVPYRVGLSRRARIAPLLRTMKR